MRKPLNKVTIAQLVKDIQKKIETDTNGALHYIGQEIVNDARETRGYEVRTGNLLNSVNYAVITDNVEAVLDTRGHSEAEAKSSEFVASLQPESGKKKLIIFAGMEYGVFVEAKGYDVISQSVSKVPEKLKEAFKK